MCGSMADIQSATAEIRRGKKKIEQERQDSSVVRLIVRYHGQGASLIWTPTLRPAFCMQAQCARPGLQEGRGIYWLVCVCVCACVTCR